MFNGILVLVSSAHYVNYMRYIAVPGTLSQQIDAMVIDVTKTMF